MWLSLADLFASEQHYIQFNIAAWRRSFRRFSSVNGGAAHRAIVGLPSFSQNYDRRIKLPV
jgi:hypothetical protein